MRKTVLAGFFWVLFLSVLDWGINVYAQTGQSQYSPEKVRSSSGPESHSHQSAMEFDSIGIVMNANNSELPQDCSEISAAVDFTVKMGTDYAVDFPGTVFGMSPHEINVPPCSLVTITLVNEDQVRHQWMLHGLPRYLYPQGMFYLEVAGGESKTGSFIVPSDNHTYLVHCDMAQHMEKGLKGQLVVGSGSGNLWSIPGVSRDFRQPDAITLLGVSLVVSMAVMSFLVVVFIAKEPELD